MNTESPAILVDKLVRHGAKGEWCHLWCEDPERRDLLDAFAVRIGLRRSWAQIGGNMRLYHYDLKPSMRTKAVAAGAIEKSMLVWMKERASAEVKP